MHSYAAFRSRTDAMRSASLTFRGFELSPDDVESMVGVNAELLMLRGAPVKPGVATVARHSAAHFALHFSPSATLGSMIPALLNHLGGVDHLCAVRERVNPEHLEIDLSLSVKRSTEQEGGFIDASTLEDVCRLGATLSFQFL
jgi:hypothetical protein